MPACAQHDSSSFATLDNLKVSVRQLRAFIRAAESQNFTKAAESLSITQAGFSAMIQDLELQLGARLFDRNPRSVALTAAGRHLLPHAVKALIALDEGLIELRRLRRSEDHAIRIGVSPMIAETALPGAICAFNAAVHGVSCEVMENDSELLFDLLELGELDAVYGVQLLKRSSLNSVALFSSKICLVVPAGETRGLLQAPHDAADDLGGMTLLCLSAAHALQKIMEKFVADRGIVCARQQELKHVAAIVAFVEAGLGCAFLPEFALDFFSGRGIERRDIGADAPSIDYFCTTHDAGPGKPHIDTFSRVLAAQCTAPLPPATSNVYRTPSNR